MRLNLTVAECNVIYRNDLMSFIERSFLELNPEARFSSSPYLELMASKLEQCRRGKLRRLIVNLPPRSLKSHSVSVAFVASMLGHDPAAQIICASYGQDLADKHARDCRTLMSSSFYQSVFPGTRLSADKRSVNEFDDHSARIPHVYLGRRSFDGPWGRHDYPGRSAETRLCHVRHRAQKRQ